MKLLYCDIQNFASYKSLEFEFDQKGLSLVSGPTGAGKSTLCDIVPWILFGRTAKGGAVDEVKTWPGGEVTYGYLALEIRNQQIRIRRVRGKNKDNDLCYFVGEGVTQPIRGKDMTDTQRMLNEVLGFDLDLYLSGAYFHEFSTAAQFFTTNAKSRRSITEQLVDLSLAKKLVDRTSSYRKEVKVELTKIQNEFNISEGVLKSLKRNIESDKQLETQWNIKQQTKLVELQAKSDDYKNYAAKQLSKITKEHKKRQDQLDSELDELLTTLRSDADLEFYIVALKEERKAFDLVKGKKCPACGSTTGNDKEIILVKREYELKQILEQNESLKRSIAAKAKELKRHTESTINLKELHSNKDNPYAQQLLYVNTEENPHTNMIIKRIKEQKLLLAELKELKKNIDDFSLELADLEILLDVTDTFRALLVKNTVVDLEDSTNKILNDYFDAEIQVKFELNDSDKLEVSIQKDGNECVYTQLSKGQRQLLKLSFAVSVMKCVSNHHGISFNAIFLDEALDGLDDVLKVKSYDLLQNLAAQHSSVFVVEHNEALKSLFPKRYEVRLSDEGSLLELI